MGPGGAGLLLAPVLSPSARPEFQQSGGPPGDAPDHGPLVRNGSGRNAAGRRAVSRRARGDELRKPAGNARVLEGAAGPRRCPLPGANAAGRSEPVARGRCELFRQRRRMPRGLPLPTDAAPVHRRADGGPLSDRRYPGANAGHSRRLPMDALPPQPRRANAGNGDRRGARLHVPRLRPRPPRGSTWASAAGWRR